MLKAKRYTTIQENRGGPKKVLTKLINKRDVNVQKNNELLEMMKSIIRNTEVQGLKNLMTLKRHKLPC